MNLQINANKSTLYFDKDNSKVRRLHGSTIEKAIVLHIIEKEQIIAKQLRDDMFPYLPKSTCGQLLERLANKKWLTKLNDESFIPAISRVELADFGDGIREHQGLQITKVEITKEIYFLHEAKIVGRQGKRNNIVSDGKVYNFTVVDNYRPDYSYIVETTGQACKINQDKETTVPLTLNLTDGKLYDGTTLIWESNEKPNHNKLFPIPLISVKDRKHFVSIFNISETDWFLNGRKIIEVTIGNERFPLNTPITVQYLPINKKAAAEVLKGLIKQNINELPGSTRYQTIATMQCNPEVYFKRINSVFNDLLKAWRYELSEIFPGELPNLGNLMAEE